MDLTACYTIPEPLNAVVVGISRSRDGGSKEGGGGLSPPTACVINELFFSLL
jgi:hypothetical protein